MAVSLVALIIALLALLVLSAAIYRAFQGQWWPLAVLICMPFGLLFVSLGSYQSVRSHGKVTTVTEDGVTRVVEIGEGAIAQGSSDGVHVSTSTRATWFGVFPILGVLAVLGFFVIKAFAGQRAAHEEGRYAHQSSGWGWLGGGILLLLILIFLFSTAFVRSPPKVEWAYGPNHPIVQAQKKTEDDGSREFYDRPTAELWDKLTAAKIDLSEAVDSSKEEENAKEEDAQEEQSDDVEIEKTPDWLKNPPKPVGKVYRAVVTSDPYSTEDECYDQLEADFYAEVETFLQQILPEPQSDRINQQTVTAMGVPLRFIMKDICQKSYTEIVDSSIGPMKKVHVLMEFDSEVEQKLLETWRSYNRSRGMATVAKVATLVLTTLVLGFVLLQVDTWTRGYYTKRLLVGVPVVIIALSFLLFA